jgi:small subunit ribosomal protein S17e
VDRIKRLSYEVLVDHKPKFGEDFADNKKVLDQIAIIRSKGLKNEIAGYITKFIKKEIRDEKIKQSQIESSKIENHTLQEKITDNDVTEEHTIEIISESKTSSDIQE